MLRLPPVPSLESRAAPIKGSHLAPSADSRKPGERPSRPSRDEGAKSPLRGSFNPTGCVFIRNKGHW